jgi:hypothetical protein
VNPGVNPGVKPGSSERRLVALAVVVPLLALPATALVLRANAPGPVHGARIEAAPPSMDGSLAWQILTEVEDRGVREAVPLKNLTATLRGGLLGAHERTWTGESNEDGVAEVHFDQVVAPGASAAPEPSPPLTLEVRSGAEVLASGPVAWEVTTTPAASRAFLPSSLRDGDLALDVAVAGARLVAGFPVPLWVRVRSASKPEANGGVDVTFVPEAGLETGRETVKTCAAGWVEVDATAIVHVAELGLEAHAADGRVGRWHGSVPVAPGASYVALPRNPEVDHALALPILLVGARSLEYAEVDDARGRVFGAVVPLSLGSEGRRHGVFTVPPLDAAELTNAWLVTSSEPTLAARASSDGATLARPLRPRTTGDACADAGDAASLVVAPFPRWIALDGFASRDRSPELHRARMARGLALGILGLAALVETWVILATSRAARDRVSRVASAEDSLAADAIAVRRPWLIVTMIVVTWLGFGVLAALIVTRS